MASEAAKVVVPESVLRKRKREELWAAASKEKAVSEKKKTIESRKLIFARAKQYAEGYPNLKSVRELIYKRGYGKLNKQRTPLTNNKVIEETTFAGTYMTDVYTCLPHTAIVSGAGDRRRDVTKDVGDGDGDLCRSCAVGFGTRLGWRLRTATYGAANNYTYGVARSFKPVN
ncbi:hypothetical protein ABZP36_003734 [Zizania latifolia]